MASPSTDDSITNNDEMWDWTSAFVANLGGQDRVYMRTYNQVVG